MGATLSFGGVPHRRVIGIADALGELEREVPSLVLLDLTLPDAGALSLCRHIKEDPSTHHVPILVVGGTDGVDRTSAFEAGADGYFDRTTRPDELLARARAAIRTCVFNQDLRQRRLALKSELAMVKRWGNSLVHDLRSPLTAIGGNLELVRRGVPATFVELHGAVSHIEIGFRHLHNLITSLLDHDRLANGLLELSLEEADVALAARQVAAEAEALARLHATVLQVAGEGRVRCDVGLIQRVIWNLVANALKHSPQGAAVTLTVGPLGPAGGTRVAVTDRGPGVAPHVRHRLFTLYGSDPKDPSGGNGIGLAFCKLVVEAHGGRIWLEDPSTGGSSFVFSLPAR